MTHDISSNGSYSEREDDLHALNCGGHGVLNPADCREDPRFEFDRDDSAPGPLTRKKENSMKPACAKSEKACASASVFEGKKILVPAKRLKKSRMLSTDIALEESTINELKALSEWRGVPYQVLMRMSFWTAFASRRRRPRAKVSLKIIDSSCLVSLWMDRAVPVAMECSRTIFKNSRTRCHSDIPSGKLML